MLASLVLAACGSAAAPAPAATSAPEATEATANETASETAAAVPTTDVSQPSGALTGAPVPPLDRSAAPLDEDRLNLDGGTFPPLVDPAVLPVASATFDDDTLVLGAVQNGEARAYPIFMMTFHHVANDVLGGEPYLVTF